jgi:hypothetical protein
VPHFAVIPIGSAPGIVGRLTNRSGNITDLAILYSQTDGSGL